MEIRLAVEADAQRLAEIYAPYCFTPISFELEPPDQVEVARRMQAAGPNYCWLVLLEGGRIVGYAYSAPHRSRAAYGWSVETSIYLDESFRGGGRGSGLYESLLDLVRAQGFRMALAGVTLPNAASLGLHRKLGFVTCAHYRQVGFKNGEWRDVEWLQLDLQPNLEQPMALRAAAECWLDGLKRKNA